MADETTTTTTTTTDSNGVTVADMQAYLAVDDNEDVLQSLIDMAETDVVNNIGRDIDIETYRADKMFNQAVRLLVDFTYNNRGGLADLTLAYPPAYAYFLNGMRWRIPQEVAADETKS
ncbi:head-tail connector protein [Lactiplantibacillus fabifermentans]|uniref:Phage gp6-like head-tail connector protein n=1 Tax=Lactiplantibacillus fabifermentans DSM 21115 TaxID=1413187 RepID=A0A0R2NZ61_9LACO|nr:head-tail connector protein [Lactiplantibacillus fabifermentans]KRO28090.1 hypothetical protein DY78_GL002672 [Lactiplantibacillus fabifermentans DSM 21115]